MKYTFFCLLLLSFLVSGALPSDSLVKPKAFDLSFIPANSFVFYVIGDWGRRGKYHQIPVAEAMSKCALIAKPEFIISTGDNFYTFGVKSTKDKLWKLSFEDIYNGEGIKNTDWFPVLGNHDHYGNQKAEIKYSKVNPRWRMSSDYYAVNRTAADSTKLTFVFTNTEPLVHLKTKKTKAQWDFIDSTLAHSTADWKFVSGHHPVYSSNPMHGNTPVLIHQLKPILEKYNAQVYFAGHDHDLQHQRAEGANVDYFVSGAGSELRPSGKMSKTLFAESIAGFALIAISGNTMYFFFIDENGNVVYQYTRGK
jgi:tartrate-resistant acid phosphatase type 5